MQLSIRLVYTDSESTRMRIGDSCEFFITLTPSFLLLKTPVVCSDSTAILADHRPWLRSLRLFLQRLQVLLLTQQRFLQPLIVVQLSIQRLTHTALEFFSTLESSFFRSLLLPVCWATSWQCCYGSVLKWCIGRGLRRSGDGSCCLTTVVEGSSEGGEDGETLEANTPTQGFVELISVARSKMVGGRDEGTACK